MTKIPILCLPFLLAGCALSPHPTGGTGSGIVAKRAAKSEKFWCQCDTTSDSEALVAVKRSSKNIVEFATHDEKA